jgi:hypothetical protein
MNSKYRWFDFASGENPQKAGAPDLDSLLGNIRSEGKPASTPKSTAKGAGAKKCQVGTSCGGTCINKDDKCRLVFPGPIGASLTKVRDMLESRMEAGAITKEQAEGFLSRVGLEKNAATGETDLTKSRGAELTSAIEDLKATHTKNEVLDEKGYEESLNHVIDTIIPGTFTPRTKNTPLTPEEVEGIRANRETWTALAKVQREVAARRAAGDEMSPEELRDKLRPIMEPLRQEISPAQVKLAKALLPDQEREYWKKAGALDDKNTGGRFPANPASDALPIGHGPLKEQTAADANNRLELLTGMYLAHGGRDIASGQRVPITHSDLEHNIAESHGGKAAEQGLNYSPLKTSLNVGRGSKDHEEYFNSVLNKYKFDANGKLTPESRAKVEEAYAKATTAGDLKKSVVAKSKAAKTVEDVKDIVKGVEEMPKGKEKDKLYNKLVSNFLTSYTGVRVAETARAGYQTHGRAEQAHYWYGPGFEGGGEAAKKITNKIVDLMSKGDDKGLQSLANTMGDASRRIKTGVNERVEKAPGQTKLLMGGDKTREIIQVVKDVRSEILKDIEAL